MNSSGVLFVTIIENKRIESMSVSIFRLPFHLKSAINFTLNVLLYSCLPSWWNCGFVKYLTCVFSNGTIILEVRKFFCKSFLNEAYLSILTYVAWYKLKSVTFHITRSPTCWKFEICLFLRRDKHGIKANL